MIIFKAIPDRVEEVALTAVLPVENALKPALWTTTAGGGPADQKVSSAFSHRLRFLCLEDGFAIVIKADPGQIAPLFK